MEWEWMILEGIGRLRSDAMDAVMLAATQMGDAGLLWIALALVLLAFPKTRIVGAAVALALILEFTVANGIIKPLVERARPFALHPGIELLIEAPADWSFPSGHTGASFAAVLALWEMRSRLFVPALLAASLIAFSRLYLFVHFPTDVAGGIAIGAAAGILGARLAVRGMERYRARQTERAAAQEIIQR